MIETVLSAIRNDDNFYNFDVTGDLDGSDKIWFRAAPQVADLNDTDAVIKKGKNVAGQSGIVDLDAPSGKFQVQLEPADTVSIADQALVFHCVLRKADVSMDTTVAKGIIQLTG